MERNEIIKAYGKDFKGMTERLLERSDLNGLIEKKAASLDTAKSRKELFIAIKPNLVVASPAEYGGTTHTEILEGIIDYLRKYGYENIVIMEGSWVGDRTSDAFEYCGYNRLSREYDIKLIDMQKEKGSAVDCAGMSLNICNIVKDVDFLINVPIVKGHCQTKVTCALKNMKGLIPNSEKRRFHSMGLHKPIAYLNTGIHQDFIVIDHICGDYDFEEGGNPVVRNCVMTALDPVLVDAYACQLIGYDVSEVPYIGIAERLKVGKTTGMRIITIEGENNEDIPQTTKRKALEVSYAVDEVESCSACYGMLIPALDKLRKEGLLDKLDTKIAIGQGHRGKTGCLGVGNCTRAFDYSVQGCPPKEEEIYNSLKRYIKSKG